MRGWNRIDVLIFLVWCVVVGIVLLFVTGKL